MIESLKKVFNKKIINILVFISSIWFIILAIFEFDRIKCSFGSVKVSVLAEKYNLDLKTPLIILDQHFTDLIRTEVKKDNFYYARGIIRFNREQYGNEEKKKYQDAIFDFNQAIKKAPKKDGNVFKLSRAWAHYMLGQWLDTFKDIFEKPIFYIPSFILYLILYIYVYFIVIPLFLSLMIGKLFFMQYPSVFFIYIINVFFILSLIPFSIYFLPSSLFIALFLLFIFKNKMNDFIFYIP